MRKSGYGVAVIGATGTVGRELVAVLADRAFPLNRLRLLATRASLGQEIEGADAPVEELAEDTDLSGTDFVFLACPEEVARTWRQRARAAGAYAIDTSAGQGELEAVPLVVPEVNSGALAIAKESRWAASPHPIAVALAVVLHPLRQLAPLGRVVATALEPVSSKGRAGVEVLEEEVRALLGATEPDASHVFPQRIAFNVCPAEDPTAHLTNGGQTEHCAVRHLRQVLDAPTLRVKLSRVHVPVFFGLTLVVDVVLQAPVDVAALENHFRAAPGLLFVSAFEKGSTSALPLPTPATVVGSDATHVACLGVDPEVPSVTLWVALDNTRKGSATNAVQIAELLLRDSL